MFSQKVVCVACRAQKKNRKRNKAKKQKTKSKGEERESGEKVAGSNPAQGDRVAEWSKAPGLGPGLFGVVGSNPTAIKFLWLSW